MTIHILEVEKNHRFKKQNLECIWSNYNIHKGWSYCRAVLFGWLSFSEVYLPNLYTGSTFKNDIYVQKSVTEAANNFSNKSQMDIKVI